MNKFPIEISGKVYNFSVNRDVLKKLNLNITDAQTTTFADSLEMIEDMFYLFLTIEQPEITRDEALKLLDAATEELVGGFETISKAMTKIMNEGFTSNPKATTKITWL